MNQASLITKPRNLLEEYVMTETLKGESLPVITKNMFHQMNKKDKKTYKKLPQKLTIYRGCHKDEANNPKCQSWTLSKKIARHFAWVHYVADGEYTYDDMKDRVVIKANILKKDVYAYLGFIRDEQECIVNLEGLKDIEIIEKYSPDMLEKLYNDNLIESVTRKFQMGKRGHVTIKDFHGELHSVNILEYLTSHGVKLS